MKELIEIVKAYDRATDEGLQTALVTLVHVDGSSYRRPGARMLVTDKGELTGAISGGCLEGDALNKALLAIHQQKNTLVTYDTSDEEDAVLGMGLGCNGIIQVLIQPLQKESGPMTFLKKVVASRQPNVIVTLFSLNNRRADHSGTCFLFNNDGSETSKPIEEELQSYIYDDVAFALASKQTSFKTYTTENAETTAYMEYVPPVASIVIAGAGNDTDPVVEMASILGWQVTLIDDGRDRNTKAGRPPAACQVQAPNPGTALENVLVDEMTFFLLMTHNYNYDLAMLRQLLNRDARYIGVLGPRKKLDRMLGQLSDEQVHISDRQRSSIYNPVGLAIGAETPEEIALSIIAEIQSVIAGKEAQSLRKAKDVIHPRSQTVIEKRKVVPHK